ncbi:MAG: hypothetical protein ABI606_09365 [Rhodoferax sp.]
MIFPEQIGSIEYADSDGELLNIYSAHLLNPTQVWEFSWGAPKEERKQLRKTWVLAGSLSEEMFDAFKNGYGKPICAESSILTTRAGATSALITTQIGIYQHRFMLPTFEPKVIDLFSSRTKDGLSLHFCSANGEGFGMLYPNSIQRPDLLRLSSFTGELSREIRAAFVETLMQSVSELLESSQSLDPSVPGSEVEVEISVLMTRGAARRFRDDDVLDLAQ